MNNQIIWTRSTGNRDIRFPPVFGPTINLVEPPEDLTTPDWVDPCAVYRGMEMEDGEDSDPPVPYIEPKGIGDDNEKE